jgi:hypothetical protein
MLNTDYFTYLAGNPEPWNAEMRRRVDGGEDLVRLQVEFHGRGRLEAKVVDTIHGWSVRYATGLMDFGLLFRRLPTYAEAVRQGTAWVNQDPDNRALFVRNDRIPEES